MTFKPSLFVLVLVAAVLIPASSALAWSNPGAYVLTELAGSELTSTVQSANLPSLTCTDYTFTTTLAAGFQDLGTVDAATTTSCDTNIPLCDVTVVTSFTKKWVVADNLLTANNNVQIAFAKFTATFANEPGQVCPANGQAVVIEGNVDGNVTYPTGTVVGTNSGCAANQERTRVTFAAADGLAVTSSNLQAVGSSVRLSGAAESPCAADANNPEMTAGTS